MKFEAHPLVVAAALGLISPGALIEDDEPEAGEWCSGQDPDCDTRSRTTSLQGADATGLVSLPSAPTEWTWSPGDAPEPEAFHRVEIEWLKQEQG